MRKTKEDTQKTRQDILQAAVENFSKKGFFNTSLNDIAKTAGVTRGAVYWHFENKAEIFNALHADLHEPFIRHILADLETDSDHPVLQLRDLMIQLLQNLAEDPNKQQVMRLFLNCDYSGVLAPFKERHKASKRESLALFEAYFKRAQDKGKLDAQADPEILTLTFHCFLKGLLTEYINSDIIDLKSHTKPLINQLFQGLKTIHMQP
ncbi:MAG: TetR family transcriptional regulator [Proteobacteria bacterium]|nr:MAG: TetR family transcriptional regulator [Pseudomonadota bacterium]